jgi:hypothetical protein
MTVSLPIAVADCVATTGCVAGQAIVTRMEDVLRLSFVSCLPKPAHGPRVGEFPTGLPAIIALARVAAQPSARNRRNLSDRDAWRRADGSAALAGYHTLNVMPNQEILMSKAFASA